MIVIIGSINLDLIATVHRLPKPGETVPGDTFVTAPGGKGANQALAARRAGARTRIVGAVGNDPFAGEALELLETAGVDLSAVHRAESATGTAHILVDREGENTIAVVPGANADVLPGHVAQAALAAGDHVLLQLEIPIETVAASIEEARRAEAISVLNTAPYRPEAASLLADADYVVANETEFDLYADALGLEGADRRARMEAFVAKTGRTVIVTLGGEGAWAATPDGFVTCPSMKITPVDTVGAGDTFCGYLAAGLAEGLKLEAALRQAAAAGALACLKPGAQPAIPLRKDVDAALA
ncbi:ribokinase [Nitratireductor aquimarinus]|uniref:ribokinase n=1 Tax=Nitratireductor aquimarinus TaxID=889300 RepID=UPI001A8E5CC5|nr:ribokinase [Nitratireductor aquimarinus]MBN8243217.1 ribokinase [Nitratireductor aquimarinus]MBY6131118.1 ribokinase [Nitratireductor aquimarinus]MCA1302126.1 ribokinase [Nitratireductor aquimarinus]